MEMGPKHLDNAIIIAVTAHGSQFDKAGEPYVLHPIRVMLRMTTHEERIVGILHDVIEDSPDYTLDDMRTMGFSRAVVEALDALTHRDGENYDAYVQRIKVSSDLARRVKLADLSDNLNKNRIPFPSERDVRRWEKYECAYKELTS
jgi:(p)ppGpp synthase/HD superfamily hydrolase